jgi:peptidoglycan hydrolase-like amidase
MGYISDPTVRWYHNKKHNNFYVPNEKREALACNQSHGQRGHSADPYLRVVAVFPTPSTFEFNEAPAAPAVIIKTSCTIQTTRFHSNSRAAVDTSLVCIDEYIMVQ